MFWEETAMVKATLSKVGSPEDTYTITLSVEKFLERHLADTEENTRKIKQIRKEERNLQSPIYSLVQRIKPLLARCVKSNPPDSFLGLPASRQHGASLWCVIYRYFTTCIPKQRKSESASITSTTNLCSPTFDSLSRGNEPVRPRDLQNDLELTKCCRTKNNETNTILYPT
jgi:hypothetical protein